MYAEHISTSWCIFLEYLTTMFILYLSVNKERVFSEIVDGFQVTWHVLLHFSKLLAVIIYDLETNHDCLCLD